MNRYEKLNQDRLVEDKICVEQKTYKVGAYCRVSTDKEDQANSFESQQRYFREYIERRPNWELVEIFADDADTGALNRIVSIGYSDEIVHLFRKFRAPLSGNTVQVFPLRRAASIMDTYT